MGNHRPRRPVRLTIASLACIAGASCATMTESECLEADWHSVGVRDGTRGRPLEHLERHREACRATGVIPDVEQYKKGRGWGLGRYCTTRSGLSEGRLGRDYENVCPPMLEPDFLRGYQLGSAIYDVNSDIGWHTSQIAMFEEGLESRDDVTEKERREVSEFLQTLEADLRKLRERLDQLERRAAGMPQ